MTATALLSELKSRGVILEAKGDKLAFWPRGKVTPDLKAEIIRYKAEILALLQSPPPDLTLADAYRRFWSLSESDPIETFHAAYLEIVTLEGQTPPEVAWQTLREAATTYHAETGVCPFCRERGPLHLPPEEISAELLDHNSERGGP